jgi:malate permease and related proteins
MDLLAALFQIVAPVFLLATVGYLWVRMGFDYDTAFVTRLSMTISLPCLIFIALARTDVDPRLLADTFLAAAIAYVGVGLLAWLVVFVGRLDTATYWAPITFGNTGNLGLPLALFAFGQFGFDLAVAVFAVMAILSFTFGVWVVSGGGSPVAAIREPIVWGTVAGIVFMITGWPIPVWAGNAIELVGQIAIPLMLITLGVAISRLQPRALGKATVISLIRAGICLSVPTAVGLWIGLPPVPLAVLILQISTPVAVTSYMLAAKYHARADEVAGLVVVSTVLSLITIPVTLAFFI